MIELSVPRPAGSVFALPSWPVSRRCRLEWKTRSVFAVRRMMVLVGSDGSFERGRQQLEKLAGVEVTCKAAVERQAEAVGEDIARQQDIQGAIQLDLPEVTVTDVVVCVKFCRSNTLRSGP